MLDHILLFNINRKAYVSICAITFGLSDLDRSESGSLKFRSIICRKGADLGHMLLLNINRKVCMGSPLVQLHLTSLEGHCQGHSDSMLISRKGAELDHMLLLDTNRKSHMESPTVPSHLTLGDLVRSKSRSLSSRKTWLLKPFY